MAKPGDTVRFLNAVGGGVITRIEGQIAYVDDDGFETPVLLKELVVVMPAGHDAAARQKHSGKLMFDQKAFDAGKKPAPAPNPEPAPQPMPEQELKVEETGYGDKISVALLFEPADYKKLTSTTFAVTLVNDSNYYLSFAASTRHADARSWELLSASVVEPNVEMLLGNFTIEELARFEKVSFQAVPFKKDRPFDRRNAIDVVRRFDLTKFYKAHCFRPGVYSESPVLETMLVKDGDAREQSAVDAEALQRSLAGYKPEKDAPRRGKGAQRNPQANPHKLLPLIEVDLHIGELTDTTAGMSNADMLELQLSAVRKTMDAHSRRTGQKIVFIHGKGEGVLRKEVLALLRKSYPKAELQDASFREYGFGATLVTIH